MGEKVAVIGAGITGIFSALYIAQSGLEVTLFDNGVISSETSGHFHGMLHSGARYAVNDQISAKECIVENRVLSEIASRFISNTGGYFVGFSDEEADYGDLLLKGCHDTGIPIEEIEPADFLKAEAHVNEDAERVFRVPDKIVHAFDFSVSAAAEARMLGTRIRQNCPVKRIILEGGSVTGLSFIDNGVPVTENFDAVVNATGPFSHSLFAESGIPAPNVAPSVGSMLVYDVRLVNSVINRMRLPSDGDIILPYGSNSVLGTIATLVEDATNYEISEDDIDMMREEGEVMVPKLKDIHESRMYSSVRPLIADGSKSAREASRSYEIIDHSTEGYSNLFSIAGGKFSSGRLIGEEAAKKLARHFGVNFKPATPDLNSSYERFLGFVKDGGSRFMKIVSSRNGTMDQERFQPALAAYIASHLEVE